MTSCFALGWSCIAGCAGCERRPRELTQQQTLWGTATRWLPLTCPAAGTAALPGLALTPSLSLSPSLQPYHLKCCPPQRPAARLRPLLPGTLPLTPKLTRTTSSISLRSGLGQGHLGVCRQGPCRLPARHQTSSLPGEGPAPVRGGKWGWGWAQETCRWSPLGNLRADSQCFSEPTWDLLGQAPVVFMSLRL